MKPHCKQSKSRTSVQLHVSLTKVKSWQVLSELKRIGAVHAVQAVRQHMTDLLVRCARTLQVCLTTVRHHIVCELSDGRPIVLFKQVLTSEIIPGLLHDIRKPLTACHISKHNLINV